MIKIATNFEELKEIAQCHASCFPDSFSSNLGKEYIVKTLEWYLLQSNRKLIYFESNGQVAGYCGYFFHVNETSGSTTGMFQHAFKVGIKRLIIKPSIIFKFDINIVKIRFLFKQLYIKILKIITTKGNKILPKESGVKTCGLVVIGVNPEFQGAGISDDLMLYFKNDLIMKECSYGILSVKPANTRAINFYKRNNWTIHTQNSNTIVMHLNSK